MSPSMPMSGPQRKPAKVDGYAVTRIETLYLKVENLYVRQFLETVLAHPDIRVVLATPIREEGKTRRLLVEAVQPIAEELKMEGYDSTPHVDAVYAATILLAIDYWIHPYLMGKYDSPMALKHLVEPALNELQKVDIHAASAIRACMRWTQFDEEEGFIEWLAGRGLWLLEFLKLMDF